MYVWVCNSAESRPWDKGKPGHPDPWERGGGGGDLQKVFVSPLDLGLVWK